MLKDRRDFGLWCGGALMLAFVLLPAGCDDPAGDSADPPLGHTDSDEHTDHEETDEPLDSDFIAAMRPLCRETPSPSVIAPDLVAWATSIANSANRFYGELEWKALEEAGDDLGDNPERVVMNHIQRGWNRLRFNDLEGAISDLEQAEALAITAAPQWRGRARELLGAAWMRKAETDNCITNPTGHACILPFDEEGMHADPTGMTKAGEALFRCLDEDFPDALSPMWLYNVSFMARGSWPDDIDARWKVPDSFLDSEGPAEPWVNHAPAVGIIKAKLAGGSALEDFDGDGLLDIMVSSMEPDKTMDLYLNMGNGQFCEASAQSGVASIPSLLSFSFADYDNDGDVDVFGPRAAWMSTHGTVRVSLLRNDGQGHFEDVAVAAGLANPLVNGPTQVGAWADVDGDGWLDLFVGREDDEGLVTGRRVSSLYMNQHDGTFIDIGAAAGVASSGFVKGASWLDYDSDGDPDLYVSSLKSKNRLYKNMGDLTFVDVAQRFEVVEPLKSFPTLAFDYNQDGLQDILVAAFTNNYGGGGPLDPSYFQSAESYIADKLGLPTDPAFSETAHLYRNTGEGFEDVTVEVGLDDIHATMGLSVGDFDMDGWPDIYYATGAPEYDALEPNMAYRNDGGLRFLDVTSATRTGDLQKGHGTSFGDIDEDGDEDLFVKMGGAFRGDPAPSVLFANPSNLPAERRRHSVTLRLEGVTSNRSAIGAKVRVVTPGRDFWATVGDTGSFGGNSLQLEFGLVDETEITRVEIQWPGGSAETVEGIMVDQLVHIRQGEGIASSRPLAPFALEEPEVHGVAP